MDKKNSRITIEWFSILRDLIRNIWVVVMAVLIGYTGMYVYSHFVYTPEYTASATLVVTAKGGSGNSYSLYSVSAEMAGVFSNVFVDPSMKTKAQEYAKNPSLNGKVSCSVLTDTNILELKVTSESPQTSYELLSAIIKVYPEISDKVFNNAIITVLRQPSMPSSPSNSMSNSNRNLVLSGCAVVSVFFILLASLLRDTVKTEESFNQKIDSKLLGTVIHEKKRLSPRDRVKKKKKALLIYSNAFISLKFVESFQKIAAKLEYMNHRNGDRVFAVTSVAENEGKSTVASNIAISLASRGNRVVLIDLDAKKPALYKIFGVDYDENAELGNLLNGKLKNNKYQLRKYKRSSLYLAVNTRVHAGYQKWTENGVIKKVINTLKQKVDYIILDTSPIFAGGGITDITKIADKTLVIVRTDVVSALTINDSISMLTDAGAHVAGCILNDVHPEFAFFGMAGSDESGYSYMKLGKYSKYGRYSKYSKYGKYGKHGRYDSYSSAGKSDGYGKYASYSSYGAYSSYGKYSSYSPYGKYSSYSKYSKYGSYDPQFSGEGDFESVDEDSIE
ncbi:MAG: P-loop NTPase [Oscillospiraceae bacterium]|nr:P-loop NTPase [Oscillospiraceae bacterium]MDD7355414.1 P-loop NTPase [Oscillospiraceae bacterium]MDY3936874.1 P-loop NTPase [Oscillospiraceae bacterium]